ncbi:MAG TPA: tail fiber domain-containing protein, partial [Acidobacteriota bacterium]|nr:tail fiber domain-containing protein [Acidobacteriota bacterium]
MGREYAIADMWRRGWDMGEEYAPSQEILDQWAAAGEPMEFGSKPTYRREIDQRMGNQGPGTTSPVLPGGGDGAVRNTAGGGDAAVRNIGGASSSFDPRQRGASAFPPVGEPLSLGGGSVRDLIGGSSSFGPRQRNDSFNPFESSLRKAAPHSKPGVIDMVRRPESSAGSPSFFFPPQGEPLEPRFPSSAGGPPQTRTPMSSGTSALDVYRGFLPVADEAIRSGVSDAMATAGFTGNRFSTSAMNRAGEVGGRVAQNLGSELLRRLYDQTQADLDRGLSATGMGLQNEQFRNQLGFQGQENFQDRLLRATSLVPQLAGSEEAIRRGRLQTPFDIFRYEQDRQDRYPLLSMDDFNRSRLGYFPYLAQLAQSRGAGQYVPPITTQQGGSPGLVDFGQAALPWLIQAGVFASDRSLKRDIDDVDLGRAYEVVEGLRPRKYRWKDTGKIDAGFVAQEVE